MCLDIELALAGLPPSSQWRPTALLLLGCTLVFRGQDALADAILARAESRPSGSTRPTRSSSRSASARCSRPRAASTRRPSCTRCAREPRRGGGARRLHDERARARRVRTHLAAQQRLGPGSLQPGLRAQPDAAADRGAALAGRADTPRACPRLRDAAGRGDRPERCSKRRSRSCASGPLSVSSPSRRSSSRARSTRCGRRASATAPA